MDKELSIGDTVIFSPFFQDLSKGTIVKITPYQITVEFKGYNGIIRTLGRYANNVVKVEV